MWTNDDIENTIKYCLLYITYPKDDKEIEVNIAIFKEKIILEELFEYCMNEYNNNNAKMNFIDKKFIFKLNNLF